MRRLAVVIFAALIVAAPLASAAPAARAKGATHHVHAVGSYPMQFSWDPEAIEIKAGDKVMWMNMTSNEHHITPIEGPWPKDFHLHLAPKEGAKAAFVFKKPGEYSYYCNLQFHGQLLPGGLCVGQCGTITVN